LTNIYRTDHTLASDSMRVP